MSLMTIGWTKCYKKFYGRNLLLITCSLYYKSFTIIIYDRNDNGLYYITFILANLTTIIGNLALAMSVNYDCKVCCKLKRTFMIVNYYSKPFIV